MARLGPGCPGYYQDHDNHQDNNNSYGNHDDNYDHDHHLWGQSPGIKVKGWWDRLDPFCSWRLSWWLSWWWFFACEWSPDDGYDDSMILSRKCWWFWMGLTIFLRIRRPTGRGPGMWMNYNLLLKVLYLHDKADNKILSRLGPGQLVPTQLGPRTVQVWKVNFAISVPPGGQLCPISKMGVQFNILDSILIFVPNIWGSFQVWLLSLGQTHNC